MSILLMFKKMNEEEKLNVKMEIYSTLKKYVNSTIIILQTQANLDNFITTSSYDKSLPLISEDTR